MAKSVHWRKDPVVIGRLALVERRHLAHQTNVAIGEALGVAEVTIRRDLDRIRELWRDRVSGEIADMKAQIVAELDEEHRLAIEAYEDDKPKNRPAGSKAAALNVARQATMDKGKVLGVIVDKTTLTDSDGNSLAELILKARTDAADR